MRVRRLLGLLVSAVLVTSVAGLVASSGGRAGSVPAPGSFQFFVEPQFVTAGEQGLAFAKFTAPLGSGTGAATKVAITFDLPVALVGPFGLPSACSGPTLVESDTKNRFVCTYGTVVGGQTVRGHVTFFAPAFAETGPNDYTVQACVTFDNGSGGAGGGGSTNTCDQNTKVDTTSVSPAASKSRAGSCGSGSASTAAISAENLQNSAVSGVVASPSLGLPCPWVFVGVNSAPAASGLVSAVSFAGLAQTDTAATWVVEFESLSIPFSKAKFLVDLAYTAESTEFNGVELPACVNGMLGANQSACLQSLEKVKKGARATVLLLGTGGDPGAGMG